MAHKTHNAAQTEIDEVKYKHVGSLSGYEEGQLVEMVRQASTGAAVIGRILKLSKEDRCPKSQAYHIAAEELSDFWIFGLNIYPMNMMNIEKKIKKIYKGLGEFKTLVEYPQKKKGASWKKSSIAFNNQMKLGFDIRTPDKNRQAQLEEDYGVKMKDEDVKLYEDN
jgi:hypothetical protein